MDRRSQLVVRRDQLQVDQALASSGVVAFSPATEAERATSTSRVVGVGAILGALLGVALAYGLALRNRRFGHRSEPELVTNWPMLAEVPRFGGNGPLDLLPVLNDPVSPAAEAFRFASSAIVARMNQAEVQVGQKQQVAAFTSAVVGDGKTVVSMNAGLSAATRGKSVLIVDGDFGDPTLTRLLVGEDAQRVGITNLVESTALLKEMVVPVSLGSGHHVDVLTRGTINIPASDFFSSSETRELFRLLRTRYDYILIDAPPLLQVSYTTNVVALADAIVAVIPHDGRVAVTQEFQNRAQLIDAPVLGYIYNKAPKRSELMEPRGSVSDPLGSGTSKDQAKVG